MKISSRVRCAFASLTVSPVKRTKPALLLRASHNMLPQLPGKPQNAALHPFFAQLYSWKFRDGFGSEALTVVQQENQLVPVRLRNPVHQVLYFLKQDLVFHGVLFGCRLQSSVKVGLAQ